MLADKMNTQNDLFDAIYAIATGVVESKNFDITKECKIVEIYTDSKGNRTGIYKVKSQNATYDAYAKKGENYYTGELVYVQIPNGDFNAQKFILGRKTDEDNGKDTYNFELPFDNFLGLYSLTEYDPLNKQEGFWANCPYHGIEEEISKSDLIWSWPSQGTISDKDNIYATRLGIEVDLTTLLHGYAPISGHYGFRIVVGGLSKTEEGLESTQITKEFFFTDNDMYGNPYAYTDGSTQQILLNIENFLQVQSINIYFWQDHNFKDQMGEIIPYGEIDYDALAQEYQNKLNKIDANTDLTDDEKNVQKANVLQWYSDESSKTSILKNIIVNGLNVYLGIMADNKDEQLILYTYNPIKYGADPEHEEVRVKERTLRLAWVHLVDKGVQLVNTQDEIATLGAKIYWYKYDELWTPDNVEYDETKYSHKFGGLYWRPIDVDGQLIKNVEPDVEHSKDRFKAVIHYNGTYITSNVLIFTNYFDIDAAKSDLAKNDEVILRCALLGEDENGVTRLIDDSAIGDFYVYDENNNILANDKNQLFSNVRYYVEPWIKVTTDTDNTRDGYQRLAEYADLDGNKLEFSITWQWPENFTMISSHGELDETIKQESTFFNNCGTAQFELYKKATRWFYIKPNYNMRYANNDIIAEIYIEGYGTCTARKTLQFGQAEAFGAEYVPVISIGIPEGNYYVDTATDFELYCLVYNRKGKLMAEEDRANCKFTWKFIGTKAPSDNRPHENYKNFQGNVIRGRINEPIPFVAEVTVSGAATYDLTVRRGIMVCNSATYMQSHDIQCPDRVEFKSDGQQPLWYSSAFEVQEIDTEKQNILIYPEWKINTTKVLRLLEKDKDYPTFTLSTGNQVTRPKVQQYALAFSKQYLTGSIAEPSIYGQQWTEELLAPEYFTYIYYEDKDSGVVVAQAIAFARNLYPSSLVNEWDGQSLSLDEENSAVLAKMISAGTKDAKNRFTGVMMGDWHEKGDDSLDTPGLYGFSGGEQSFGFKTDGTGFIGPAGYGRIQFDGRNALISNATKTCYINLNPRLISAFDDLDTTDEPWDGIGQQGYSQYFLYCELPQVKNAFAAINGDDLWWRQNSWATPYLNNLEGHDYFIVDPNNGILTTGGIFARYGQIGTTTPWIIHNNGLTQKNNYGTIFLGNPEKNPSSGTSIPNLTFTSYNKDNQTYKEEVKVDNNFFSASFSNIKNIIQTGIRADGYFYTKFATIGGWFINNNEIYSTDVFRKEFEDSGYQNDIININSKHNFISFDNGRFIISGRNKWMGLYSEGYIENIASPSKYDMLINFADGTMGFKKDGGNPYTLINGKTGEAYFSQGNIYFDGKNAIIYCGKSIKTSTSTVTVGAINLAGMQIEGTSPGDILYKPSLGAISYGASVGDGKDTGYFTDAQTIGFSEGDDTSNAQQLNTRDYKTYLATTKLEGSKSTFEADGLIAIIKNTTGNFNNTQSSGNGLYIYTGDNGVLMRPTSTIGYLVDWKIWALGIRVNGSIYSTGSIISNSGMSMVDECTETDKATGAHLPGLIATRAWVSQRIDKDIMPAIKVVNNAAASAMSTANKALSKANKALTDVKNSSIVDIKFTTPGIDNGGFKGLKVVVTKGNGNELTTDGIAFAEMHQHDDTIKTEDGKIVFQSGNVVSKNSNSTNPTVFSGDSDIGFSANKDGTINFSITIANKKGTKTFNMADTAFYKSAAVKSAQIVNVSGASCHIEVTFLNGETKSYATATLKLEDKQVNLINSNQETAAYIKLTGFYNKAYNAGANSVEVSRTEIATPSSQIRIFLTNGKSFVKSAQANYDAGYNVGYAAGKNDVDTAKYNEGWNDCRDAMLSHKVLSGYTKYGSSTTLYSYHSKAGKYVVATGSAKDWYYNGTEVTYYSKPAEKK